MALCCGSSGTPFIQTTFLGASITRFSAQVDWNGTGGGMQVELVEDPCNGDSFEPPGVGMPVFFRMGGFTHGGILQNWKQNDASDGPKHYTVNVMSPRDIIDGCQIILSSYNGPTFGVPNLVNVYGWLEANYGSLCGEVGFTGSVIEDEDNDSTDDDDTPCKEVRSATVETPRFSSNLTYPPAPGFGGAFNNEVGIQWQLIKRALSTLLGTGGGAYGGRLKFRGHEYIVDISDLPPINAEIRIGGENMSLEALIARVCALGGVDYFYDLYTTGATCGGSTLSIIKVRTSSGSWQAFDQSAQLVDSACSSQIDARLSLGTISHAIGASTCITRYGRGLELRSDVTNAFLTGEFRQEIWQTQYEDEEGEDACEGMATIWPYWGKNPDGTVILGKGCSSLDLPSAPDELNEGHTFVIKTDHLGVGVEEWEVTLHELHAALVSQHSWEAWLAFYEKEKYAKISGENEQNDKLLDKTHALGMAMANTIKQKLADAQAGNAEGAVLNAKDFVNMWKENVENLGAPDDEQLRKNAKLFDFVRKFAQEFYGRKFMVRLPFLCKRYNTDTPWTIQTNWETTDSGWTEWPVLGIPNQHWILDQFRADDGKIRCFMKFVSERPMMLDNLSRKDYFACDMYTVFVSGSCDDGIVWVGPNDARAVVTLSGPIQQYNKHDIKPEWLLGFAITSALHNNDKKAFMTLMKSVTNDKFALGMLDPFLMPVAAAIPLQSTRLVYGPWFAKKSDFTGFNFFGGGSLFSGSDNGRTEYQREAGFAPWNFGSWALMDWAAYNTASAMLGDKYVLEMGDITFPGAPVGSLGSLIDAGGPAVSNIDVQIGRGDGAVLTTYRMRTHTPQMGQMAKQRIDQMRHNAQVAIKAERMFRKYTLERLRNEWDNKLDQEILAWTTSKGESGSSSHDFMSAQAGIDFDGPGLEYNTGTTIQTYHMKPSETLTTHVAQRYEETSQADEPHGESVMGITEGRKELRGMRADNPHFWRRRAYMDTIGMFRGFSTLPHTQKADKDDAYFLPHWRNEINRDLSQNGDLLHPKFGDESSQWFMSSGGTSSKSKRNVSFFSHDQVPPLFCLEDHLPINITTLSPFLDSGGSLTKGSDGWGGGGAPLTSKSSVGHDISYIARDGVYPTHLSVRVGGYSENHWYRAMALKGPLVLAGWGFDIDNKPVPNASTEYPNSPKMEFEQDWLRKPQKWVCGPVDLRWDYKRHVWVAPSPMKIVKMELAADLCPQKCAKAIIYDDQRQYDKDGTPIDEVVACRKSGYEVTVFSEAMYAVPKGWRIMAHYDTTLNRYEMINHDPLPLVEVNILQDMRCDEDLVDGAVIVGPAGDCSLDPCGSLTGMPIDLQNPMNQPICAPRKALVWICGFECEDGGEDESSKTLDDCEHKCQKIKKAKGVIVQAEFHPDCVVTHVELLEYYCWGYDVSCDEEDIELWSQGDVDVAWDWCFNMDTVSCVPSFTVDTNEVSHSHIITDTVEISGEISGVTDTTTDTVTIEIDLPSRVIIGETDVNTSCVIESTGTPPTITGYLLGIDDGIGVDKSVTDMTGTVNCSGSNCYCECDVTLSGGTVNINSTDILSLIDMTVYYNSGTVIVSGELCEHTHPFSAEISSYSFVSEITLNHQHPFAASFTDSVNISAVTDTNTHKHTVEIPCKEACVNSDASFDLDIDTKFIPGYCTLRVAVLNKNFWEYYWYALCVGTRALWHQGEMGPASTALNTTPPCSTDCADITCDEPTYDCPVAERNQYSLAYGEDVSWFGFDTDTTLLNTETNCVEHNPGAVSASAQCESISLSDCCVTCNGATISKLGGEEDAGDRAWQSVNPGDLTSYCPDGYLDWKPFLRDYELGIFNFIADDAADHIASP